MLVRRGRLAFDTAARPTIALVRDGALRVFLVSEAGRQVTVGYARVGALVGLAPVLAGVSAWNAEAVGDATVAMLTLDDLRTAAGHHPDLPWLIVENIAAWCTEAALNLGSSRTRTVASRLAGHLGEMAEPRRDGILVVRTTHQHLADAVGTAREVITRALASLRAQSIIELRRGSVMILSESRLRALAAAA